MTLDEMSSQFDVLYNNALSNAAPGLDEYEKSVFLTKAQNEIVKNYFNPNGNKYKEGFDGSAKRQVDFNRLIKAETTALYPAEDSFEPRALRLGDHLSTDVFIVLNERVAFFAPDPETDGFQGTPYKTKEVVPIAYDEYARIMAKPYKEPLKNQAWRIILGTVQLMDDVTLPSFEIVVSSGDLKARNEGRVWLKYSLRYVKRPNPIILTDLSSIVGDVTIDGIAGPSSCELDPYIHEEILQRAVELAKAAYASDQSGQAQMQNQITVGQRSE